MTSKTRHVRWADQRDLLEKYRAMMRDLRFVIEQYLLYAEVNDIDAATIQKNIQPMDACIIRLYEQYIIASDQFAAA